MEDLQTDTLFDFGKSQNPGSTDLDSKDNENACAGSLLNGCDDIDDPLDLMDNCDNGSIGSNSDIWKGSDSEDESFENKTCPTEILEENKSMGEDTSPPATEEKQSDEIGDSEQADSTNKDETTNETNKETVSVTENEQEDQENNESHTENTEEATNTIENEEDEKTDSNIQEDELLNDSDENQEENNQESVNNDEEQKETDQETAKETPDINEGKVDAEEQDEVDKEQNEDGKEQNEIDKECEDGKEQHDIGKESEDGKNQDENAKEKDEDARDQDKDDKEQGESAKETDLSNDVTADKDSSVEITTDKDLEEVTDKDPLAIDTTDKDPLAIDMTDKDPLAVDTAEKEVTERELPTTPRKPDRNNEGQDDDDSQIDYNDDDDFDPSLLCPEVSMAVDENPVITTSGPMPGDGNSSPLPYEPVFSTFVDEVTGAEISFNLTAEEQELRRNLYGPGSPIQYSRIHCTACNVHLGSALAGQSNRFVHPLLKVLICKECYHFYTSGEFEKDEDGSELYCRWCGQGGQVLCCSKCEYVFCKRCIRTNFGRKKMFEIRDSDNWDCFRCVPSQIITQRVACYEFFEYVRREMARASTLTNSEFWKQDFSRCCMAKKKAAAENGEEVVKKPVKRRKGEVDPDYSPMLDKVDPKAPPPLVQNPVAVSAVAKVQTYAANKGITIPKPVQIVPRLPSKDNDIEFVRHIPAPHVAINPVRMTSNMPTFRTILPSSVKPVIPAPTVVRINSQTLPSLVSTGNRFLGSALQGQRIVPSPTMMKHEWFEKTVRAAARVNSHLSYTLTQLNKAQSQAASVEELAVVHNKLQEILSSSINSLIQIRKNLRTEFIAGIKTVRLPSKKATETFNNDDDVIFVSAPTAMPMPSLAPCSSQMRMPPPATPSTSSSSSLDPVIIIDNSKKAPPSATETVTASTEKPRLKVKSVMELQNVPSECITIPDDTPISSTSKKGEEANKTEKEEKVGEKDDKKEEKEEKKEQNEKNEEKEKEQKKEENEQKNEEKERKKEEAQSTTMPTDVVVNGKKDETPDKGKKTTEPETSATTASGNTSQAKHKLESTSSTSGSPSSKAEPPTKKLKLEINAKEREIVEPRTRRSKTGDSSATIFNIKDAPPKEIKRMVSVTVKLPRVDLEELQKRLPNGCH